MKEIEISEKEYIEKKLEVAKNLLPAMVAKQTEEFMQDKRKRASLIYNCVAISEDLLKEAGYKKQSTPAMHPKIHDRRSLVNKSAEVKAAPVSEEEVGNRNAIRKLSEMLPETK